MKRVHTILLGCLYGVGYAMVIYATCSWIIDQYQAKLAEAYDRGVTDALSTPESKQHADAAAMMWWYETKDMDTVRKRLCGKK